MRLVGTLVVFSALAGVLFWAYKSGWVESFTYKTVEGVVGERVDVLPALEEYHRVRKDDCLYVFDIITDDGGHVTIGFDHQFFAFERGKRVKVTIRPEPIYTEGYNKETISPEAIDKDGRMHVMDGVFITRFKVKWYPVVEYKILKDVLKGRENK